MLMYTKRIDLNKTELKEIEILNPIHPGFYESCISFDYEWLYEDIREIERYKKLTFLNMEPEADIKEYEKICTEKINDYFIELINEISLNLFDIEDLILCKKSELLTSPREYNFETDKTYIKVYVDGYKYRCFINLMFNKYYKELEDYIYRKHSSYDGFISFYSNDIKTWIHKYYELDYNELKTVFMVLLNVYYNIKDKYSSIYNINDIIEDLYEISHDVSSDTESWFENNYDGKKLYYSDLENMFE